MVTFMVLMITIMITTTKVAVVVMVMTTNMATVVVVMAGVVAINPLSGKKGRTSALF
jgi:hypothetical protein